MRIGRVLLASLAVDTERFPVAPGSGHEGRPAPQPKPAAGGFNLRRVGLGTAFLVALSCGGAPDAPPSRSLVESAAPVILVIVDTLRADHLGLYGYARPTSPTLDAWATHGRVFDRAFAPSPWTLPSVASIYTGRWPLIHQAGRAERPDPTGETGFLGPIPDLPTLAQTLSGAGVRTLAVTNNAFLTPSFDMTRGFDVNDFDADASDSAHRSAEETVHRALEMVDEVAGQPFFLVVHLFDPHLDYDAPPPFRNVFTASIPSTLALPIETLRGAVAPQDVPFAAAAYDEEIAYVDAQLGVLRDGLADRGLLETSLIIFTADHGEELFEHGDFGHGHAMWQELLHVPLVVWAPGVEPGRESAPVSLVDIAPTVLDRLGIDPPAPVDGISLWPTLSASVPLPPRPLFGEGMHHGPPQSVVVRWPHKMIVDHANGRVDVFDLAQDPHEQNHRVDAASEIPRLLTAELCRHQRAVQQLDRPPAAPDREVVERLRSLGYLRVNAGDAPHLRNRQFPCFADIDWRALVHVDWVDTLGETQRTAIARSLGLERAEYHEGTTWKYRMPDATPDRLRALVEHEMVEDTHGFDRATLDLDAWVTR